ncbi:hypothetical protein Bca52824_010608 [Brassica carinata]|uniref:Uncharacterized protein n=1 Tax=Brassica carinata TaxID=52824 RepID=A0A8X8BAB2_BRACI|nr:hypothetical protein Bca52824_010608 [Brassica carinata]
MHMGKTMRISRGVATGCLNRNRDGWIHGNRVKENDSQRLVGVPALDASSKNPLTRYQNLPYNPLLTQTNPSNAGLMSVEGHSEILFKTKEICRNLFT